MDSAHHICKVDLGCGRWLQQPEQCGGLRSSRGDPFISPRRQKHNAPLWERLAVSAAQNMDTYRKGCPVEHTKVPLKTEEGRRLYVARKATAEPVFGIIKRTVGFRQFLTRGLEAVQSE